MRTQHDQWADDDSARQERIDNCRSWRFDGNIRITVAVAWTAYRAPTINQTRLITDDALTFLVNDRIGKSHDMSVDDCWDCYVKRIDAHGLWVASWAAHASGGVVSGSESVAERQLDNMLPDDPVIHLVSPQGRKLPAVAIVLNASADGAELEPIFDDE